MAKATGGSSATVHYADVGINEHYADLGIMPTVVVEPLVGAWDEEEWSA
jgi:hypothetical protein